MPVVLFSGSICRTGHSTRAAGAEVAPPEADPEAAGRACAPFPVYRSLSEIELPEVMPESGLLRLPMAQAPRPYARLLPLLALL